jgi:hypothetical protein
MTGVPFTGDKTGLREAGSIMVRGPPWKLDFLALTT